MRPSLFIFIYLITAHLLSGQIDHFLYVDFSQQMERTKIIEKLDSVISDNEAGNTLLYVSNGGTPEILESYDLRRNYKRVLTRVRPSLPSPYFELDTLISIISSKGGFTPQCRFDFFFSGSQAKSGESHITSIFEKLLLIKGIIADAKIEEDHTVNIFINLQSERAIKLEYANYQYSFVKGVNTIKY